MAVASNKTRVMITFANSVLADIDEICEETGLSRTEYVNMLVHFDIRDRAEKTKEKRK